MELELKRVKADRAMEVVTPRLLRKPKTRRELVWKYTKQRFNQELEKLDMQMESNRKDAYFGGDRSLLQRVKLICANSLSVMAAVGRITLIAIRYLPGLLVPRIVLGNEEFTNPPAFRLL